MKRAQSMGAIPSGLTVSAQPVELGWAQTENVAKLGTSAGAPQMAGGRPTIDVNLSPKAQKLEGELLSECISMRVERTGARTGLGIWSICVLKLL